LKNKKFIIGAIVVLAAIGFLGVRAFAGSATYYYDVADFVSKGASVEGKTAKVRGFVEQGSVVRQGGALDFSLMDENGASRVPIIYQGVVPDTFKEGSEVVCEGALNGDGAFRATVLMPKCPSKYTPASGSPS
jgi:cytochrome c-type biogenesis protein CcmE